ncbi:MAG: hypothetical protein GX069_10760 [Tissierellia bacterium]|nr:hypothetical protein [Tissierellia bacterium]
MSRILALVKVDIRNTFSLSTIKNKLKNRESIVHIVIVLIALISLLPTYYFLVSGLSNIFTVYLNVGQKSMFLLTGILLGQMIVLFFGILYVMSKYYFSSDLNILVPLPLRPKEIVGAKFVSLLIYEYLTLLPILLPFIIIYGIKSDVNILYWLYSTIIILFVPVIPLCISSIIVMFFMRYTNIRGKRDLLRTIGYIVLIIALITIQLKLQSIAERAVADEDFLYKLITDSTFLARRLGIVFPPSMWAALSLSDLSSMSGFLYLLLFVIVSILMFFIMLFLSDRVFFKGLIGNLEVSTSRRAARVRERDFQRSSPPYIALAMKEIKMLVRTPVYLMNSIGGVIIVPIVMILPFFMEDEESVNMLRSVLRDSQQIINLIGVAFITFLGIVNSVCSTTFSREGKNMWIQRTLPIKVKDQIVGRVLASIFVQIIGIIILYGSLAYLGALTLEGIFIIGILGILGSIPTGEIGMIVDAYRPMLHWDNPQRAMKQNLNVLINMGLGSLYILGIGLLAYKLLDILDIFIIYIIIALIFILSSLVLYKVLKKVIETTFINLE